MFDLEAFIPLVGMLAAAGAIAGVLAGLLGVGGGIVLVPAFYYIFSALGYAPEGLMQICLATSLATIVFTSARSVRGHHRKGAVDWDVLRGWAPWIVLGAAIGVVAANGLKSQSLMLIFGVLGCVIGIYLAFGRPEWRLGEALPKGAGRSAAGGTIGFLSVLMGIGGGSFAVPLMTLYATPIHRAVATASGFGLAIALPSVIGFFLSGWGMEGKPPFTVGLVNLPAFALVVAMTQMTAPVGVRLAHALPAKVLKRFFAAFVFLMALNMLRKALIG